MLKMITRKRFPENGPSTRFMVSALHEADEHEHFPYQVTIFTYLENPAFTATFTLNTDKENWQALFDKVDEAFCEKWLSGVNGLMQ
jgi:hypothetical protein